MPVAQPGRETGDVVGREGTVAQGAVDLHLAHEILVIGPRIADQREVGNLDVRPGGEQRCLLEAHAAVDQVEAPREAVELEAAALAGRQGLDGGVDGLAVDGEVVGAERHVGEVHVPEIDAVGRIAVHAALKAELHPFDHGLFEPKPEVALLGTVGVGKAAYHLPDVHLALGRLAQEEFRPRDLGAGERHPAAPDAEAGDVGVEPVDVEQRVALVILDVETVDPGLAQHTDVDTADGHRGLQLPGSHAHDLLHRPVLHGGYLQQQRHDERQHDDRHDDRHEHLSQYFYTFAHEWPYKHSTIVRTGFRAAERSAAMPRPKASGRFPPPQRPRRSDSRLRRKKGRNFQYGLLTCKVNYYS